MYAQDKVGPLCFDDYKGPNRQYVEDGKLVVDYCIGNGQVDQLNLSNKVGALNCMHDQQIVMKENLMNNELYPFGKEGHPQTSEGGQGWTETEVTATLNPFDTGESRSPTLAASKYAVRRLLPEECEILQGYPVGYTDIGEWIDSKGKVRKTTDSARYKALGNSICLPPWKWVLKRICATYERDATMGSLFDGIGGFPLLWEQLNYPGSCLWASEIEEFPIAVTERRINGARNYPTEQDHRGVEP